MNTLLKSIVFFLISFCFACDKKVVDAENTQTSTLFYPNSAILGQTSQSGINGYYEITEGNKIVFEFINSTEGEIQIADDEFYENFVFQIEANQSDKEWKDAELLKLNPIYRYSCFCTTDLGLENIRGSLSIKKKSKNKWSVTSDITLVIKRPRYSSTGQVLSTYDTFEQKINFKQEFSEGVK